MPEGQPPPEQFGGHGQNYPSLDELRLGAVISLADESFQFTKDLIQEKFAAEMDKVNLLFFLNDLLRTIDENPDDSLSTIRPRIVEKLASYGREPTGSDQLGSPSTGHPDDHTSI